MSERAPEKLEVESEDVYVVYHPKSGDVVHVHRVFNYRGADRLPSGAAGEARALEMAARFGHRTKGLRALTVSPDEVRAMGPKRVDVKRRKLVLGSLDWPRSRLGSR